MTYTYFDIRNYRDYLNKGIDKRLIELYKVFSPEHLLKKRFQNDSNSLNTKFYSELLYIIGLEEVEEKDSNKRIITRREADKRNPASILENAITVLDSEDWLYNIKKRSSFGKDKQEQLFNIALSLTIGWINRILFLKLLEAQLVKYHKGDTSYAFLRPGFIPDYDELNKLFFQVLAKRPNDRSETINKKFGKIPYLNSSLFELSALERNTIRISSLDNSELPLYSNTVLKDGQKPRYKQLTTLRYLLEFLDAYDFADDGSENVQENTKTLINASVLGLIFEKINGHKDGSVFTPGSITMYMSREAVQATVVQKFNQIIGDGKFCSDYENLKDKDITDFKQANAIVNSIRICDPAVGSGHFLVSVLNEIIRTKYDLGILLDCNGKRIKKQDWNIEIENDELIVSDSDGEPFVYIPGNAESQRIQEALFNEKRRIIENCLFGVDLNPNAVNICRLRLWIELLKNAYYTKESGYTELETLPNIDINIKNGNSLIHRFELQQDISEILKKTDITISQYKNAVNHYKNAHNKEEKRELEQMISTIKSTLRTQIQLHDPKILRKRQLEEKQKELLAPQLFEISKKEQTLRERQAKELQTKIDKLNAQIEEIESNKMYVGAFEWRIEFPEVLDDSGNFTGFDCVIGNPPILRGRDIKRYGYNWANLWLIYIPWHFPLQFDESITGASEKAETAFQEQYPAVYQHMLEYKEPLSKRNKAETGIRYEWYAMQRWGAKYWEDFFKPKVVYMEIQTDNPNDGYPFPCFSYDNRNSIALNTAYIMCSNSVDVRYVLGILNSTVGRMIARLYVTQLQERQYRMLAQYISKFPIAKSTSKIQDEVIKRVQKCLDSNSTLNEEDINRIVYQIYGFESSEIAHIENLI